MSPGIGTEYHAVCSDKFYLHSVVAVIKAYLCRLLISQCRVKGFSFVEIFSSIFFCPQNFLKIAKKDILSHSSLLDFVCDHYNVGIELLLRQRCPCHILYHECNIKSLLTMCRCKSS